MPWIVGLRDAEEKSTIGIGRHPNVATQLEIGVGLLGDEEAARLGRFDDAIADAPVGVARHGPGAQIFAVEQLRPSAALRGGFWHVTQTSSGRENDRDQQHGGSHGSSFSCGDRNDNRAGNYAVWDRRQLVAVDPGSLYLRRS
jgi:hypothetical protein